MLPAGTWRAAGTASAAAAEAAWRAALRLPAFLACLAWLAAGADGDAVGGCCRTPAAASTPPPVAFLGVAVP
eukprot:4341345-Prymnesium_polylepis.1